MNYNEHSRHSLRTHSFAQRWESGHVKKRFRFAFLSLILLFGSEAGDVEAQNDQPEPEYFALFMDERKIGHGKSLRRVNQDRVVNRLDVLMAINRNQTMLQMRISETTIETLDGKPLGFESEQNLGTLNMKMTGKVNDQGAFDVTINTGNVVQNRQIDWPTGTLMNHGLSLCFQRAGLDEGVTFPVKVFSPSTLEAIDNVVIVKGKKEVDLLGRVVELTEVLTKTRMGSTTIPALSYMDDEFNEQKVILQIMGILVEMVACSKEFALSENDVPDFVDHMVVACPRSLPDVKETTAITYHLVPVRSSELTLPSGAGQQVCSGGQGKLIVTVKPITTQASSLLPYRGKDQAALEALKPTRFIQSESEEIIALARRAVGDAAHAAQAAGRIESFVYDYIRDKDLSVGYASAIEVVRSRQGDCTEHALLTTALCQAAGIPARVVNGMVYVKRFARRQNVFVGHAWTQVFIGEQWICLDATRAPNGYSAGHLILETGNGNPEGFFNLVNALGSFRIDKVEINK